MSVPIHRERLFTVMLMVDVMFVVLHLLTRVVTVGGDTLLKSHEFLDLDAEISFPTWWQQSQLLAAAALCLLVGGAAADTRRERRYWIGLGVVFLYLSADEGTQFHEGLIDPMRDAFDISGGAFTFAWVIPGIVAVAVFGTVYVRFWWGLPSRPRLLMGIAGASFLAGALGFEMVSGSYKTERGIDRGYAAVTAAEEALEMVGASLFILSVFTVIAMHQQDGGIAVRVVSDLE